MNDALPPGRTRRGKYGEGMNRGMDREAVLAGGAPQEVLVRPNV